MLAGIDEATNYPRRCGGLEAVLFQIRSSLNIALNVADRLEHDPQRAMDYLKKSVREAIAQAEDMEKNLD